MASQLGEATPRVAAPAQRRGLPLARAGSDRPSWIGVVRSAARAADPRRIQRAGCAAAAAVTSIIAPVPRLGSTAATFRRTRDGLAKQGLTGAFVR
jgi:hypothetical protein